MKTKLYDEHVKLQAKIVDFAGWQMPIQYKNLKEEVLAVRKSAGVFDVSHMGEFLIKGNEAQAFCDFILPNEITKASDSKAIYSPLCREDGTIIDDLIAYKLKSGNILLCVNASNIEKDFAWIEKQSQSFDVKIENLSDHYSLVALQGPESFKILSKLNTITNVKDMEYYSIQEFDDNEQTPTMIARTGYTGEDGFEIFGSHEKIQSLWAELIDMGVIPCGLGARDVLRLEVCYPLYGNELNDQVTPFESGLKWTVKIDKNFIGKESLQNNSSNSQLIKLTLDKGIPRAGYEVFNQNDELIGSVTSGTLSVMLEKGIAIARVDKSKYTSEDDLYINIRNKKYHATRSMKPFYQGGIKK